MNNNIKLKQVDTLLKKLISILPPEYNDVVVIVRGEVNADLFSGNPKDMVSSTLGAMINNNDLNKEIKVIQSYGLPMN